jgi:hypothetical protein
MNKKEIKKIFEQFDINLSKNIVDNIFLAFDVAIEEPDLSLDGRRY